MKVMEVVKISVAEVIGTALLLFMGCLGCLGSLSGPPASWQAPFSFAFAVMIAVQSVGHVSGAHLNPCVTVAAIVLEVTNWTMGIFYFLSQCFGALLGYGLIKAITPTTLLHSGNETQAELFCITFIHEKISLGQGFLVEILATGILVLMLCGLWDKRNSANTDSSALRVACGIFVLCVAFGSFTGCSMNPVRSLAPAVWNNYWKDHWVFWTAPFVGALVSSIFYRFLLWPETLPGKTEEIPGSTSLPTISNGV